MEERMENGGKNGGNASRLGPERRPQEKSIIGRLYILKMEERMEERIVESMEERMEERMENGGKDGVED